jgi:hypothetical protein
LDAEKPEANRKSGVKKQRPRNDGMEDDEHTQITGKNVPAIEITQTLSRKRKRESPSADAQPIKTEKKDPPKEITQAIPRNRKKKLPVADDHNKKPIPIDVTTLPKTLRTG